MVRLFGVIGHPVSHSRSPAMHAAALRALKIDAVYSAFDVPPRFVRPMLQAFVLAGVEGLNVTVPLKEVVLPLLDRIDPVARAIGAVNTIVIRNRRLIGYNTDAKGFALALRQLGWRRRPAHAVILGAGGAAKAVAWELSRTRGMRLIIANRHLAKAQRLARWIARRHPGACAHAVPLARVRLEEAQLLINATTVGMRAGDPAPVALKGLRRSTLVYDVVYHRPTRLVAEAQRRGCVAAGGLSMLLYQGAESLRLWLHRDPPIDIMRKALERAITNDQIPSTK